MFLKVLLFVSRLILHTIARVELHGFERIPQTGGCIVVTNHLGRMDAMLGVVLAHRNDIIMMVAEKYQKNPFWRRVVEKVDGIWLNRGEADFHALRLVHKRLQSGGIAAIAPEGTRSKAESLLPGKPGAAYLAVKAGVPLVPVGLTGTEDRIVRQRLRRLRRLHIVINVGEPFELPPLKRENRDEQLATYTDEIMCHIAALLPPKHRGVYANHPRLQELLAKKVQEDE